MPLGTGSVSSETSLVNGFDVYFTDSYSARVYNNPHRQAHQDAMNFDKNKAFVVAAEVYVSPKEESEYGVEIVHGFKFETHSGKTYGPYCKTSGTTFRRSEKKLIGLFGRCGWALNVVGFIWQPDQPEKALATTNKMSDQQSLNATNEWFNSDGSESEDDFYD